MKLDLEKPILDTKGNEVIDEIKDEKGKVKESIKRTVREDLLKLLGIQYDTSIVNDPKHYTWIYYLSVQLNKKDKEIEIEGEQLEFLKKLVAHNKVIFYQKDERTGGIVQRESTLFTPFEAGQLLSILGEK